MKLTREEVLRLAMAAGAKPILYTDTINSKLALRDDLWLIESGQIVHLAVQLAESAVAPGENNWLAWQDRAPSGMQPPTNQPNSDHVAVISAKPESRVPDGFLPMESAPLDGTEILLLTKIGIVSAWFAKGEWKEHFETGREYTGAQWVCYDDKFQIEVEETEHGNFSEAIGWLPKPGQSGISSLVGRPNEQNAVQTERPSLSDEREEDEYVIDRLSTILAGVSIAFKGEELPLHRHSYHDLAELAKAKMLEIDLLNHQIAELSAAQRQDSNLSDAAQEWKRRYDGMEVLFNGAKVVNEQYSDVLRGLASYVAAGGFNSDGLIPAETADAKIRWGIDHLQRQDSDKDAERYRLIRSIVHMSVKQQNAITEAMDILPDDDGIPTIEQFDAVVDAGIAFIANGAPK